MYKNLEADNVVGWRGRNLLIESDHYGKYPGGSKRRMKNVVKKERVRTSFDSKCVDFPQIPSMIQTGKWTT